MQETLKTSTFAFVATVMLLSFAVGYFLWQKHASGRHLLTYEPRRRVPWGPLPALVVFVLPTMLVLFLSDTEVTSVEDLSPTDFIYLGWIQSLAKLSVVIAGLACLATFLRADPKDLGLPQTLLQSIKDCRLGLFACLAAMLPIYLVQYAISSVIDSQQQHELLDKLLESYSPQMFFVVLWQAVFVAAIYEEFVFRLLFQGWLEKREDQLVGYSPTDRRPVTQPDDLQSTHPARGMIPELPHGWTPVLVSGVLFGLAHIGQNVAAPVSLSLFGIVLGYLYQRTHRLLPCIVAHMVFNAFTMALLWLQLGNPPV
ncbi:MAG: CPBP family intramembrane metalloprotease [Pirellulales bacterium]|nr:CPBP family intramembrane metalloprotease [Pirellulales bacterium]